MVGLIVAVALFLSLPVNTNDFVRGAKKTDDADVLRNMVVMLLGELVVSDGIITYMSQSTFFKMDVGE